MYHLFKGSIEKTRFIYIWIIWRLGDGIKKEMKLSQRSHSTYQN